MPSGHTSETQTSHAQSGPLGMMTAMSDARAGAIIVGGGHNGLVCAAYLARAGMTPLVLEARSMVGGCAGSEDVIGARVNICNCDHGMVRSIPLMEELALAEHGLEYIDLDPGSVLLGWESGGPFPIFHSVDRTLDALAITHPGQVDNYRRYAKVAVPVAELIVEMAGRRPTGPSLIRGALGHAAALPTLLTWMRRSVGDVLRSFFDDAAILGPAVAAGPAVWGVSPETPGTGLGALTMAFKHVVGVGRPIGGSGQLTEALAGAIRAAGGEVRTDTPVASITCEGERIRGVELSDGTLIDAPVVVIACDPREAIVRYLSSPPSSAKQFVKRWTDSVPGEGYESKVDARLTELPRWRDRPSELLDLGFDDQLTPSTIVAPPLATIARGHDMMTRGEILDRPIMFINVPSVRDSKLAPAGEYVFSLEVLFTPYCFRDGWSEPAEPERWIDVASTLFEPGFVDSIAEWRAVTPAAYEREYNLPKGHATSFTGGPIDAVLGRRPELTRYQAPIDGLYLTGAATFPGAGVWGASGRNAASVILATANA